jgi:hypothetical protein
MLTIRALKRPIGAKTPVFWVAEGHFGTVPKLGHKNFERKFVLKPITYEKRH